MSLVAPIAGMLPALAMNDSSMYVSALAVAGGTLALLSDTNFTAMVDVVMVDSAA